MNSQNFVFFGIAGSGKGTQVKLLMEFLKQKDGKEALYIYTGDLYREIVGRGNYTSKLVKDSLERGELQPDFMTNAIFTNAVSVINPENFEKIIDCYKRGEVKIIYIKVGKEEATKRNLLRGRSDDTPEGMERRYNEYINNVLPSMNYFQAKAGYEIVTVNGEQSVEDVHKDIISKLGFSF